jgi:hypothetical protein
MERPTDREYSAKKRDRLIRANWPALSSALPKKSGPPLIIQDQRCRSCRNSPPHLGVTIAVPVKIRCQLWNIDWPRSSPCGRAASEAIPFAASPWSWHWGGSAAPVLPWRRWLLELASDCRKGEERRLDRWRGAGEVGPFFFGLWHQLRVEKGKEAN